MLHESRLYSFIDNNNGFTLHFLEGQKLIHDLAMINNIKGKGFAYFRDSILTAQQMISYLKPGEGLGFFIDSEKPYFRLKVEMNEAGSMRTLLLPEAFNEFPETIHGTCRLSKVFPNNPQPYTSILELENTGMHEVVEKVLKDSYQIPASIKISESSDQSILLMKLPSKNVDKESIDKGLTSEQYWDTLKEVSNKLFDAGEMEQVNIQKAYEEKGLTYLGSKEIKFKCSCSHDRMLQGVVSICLSSGVDNIFDNGKEEIETKCDYCKSFYQIARTDVVNQMMELKSK